MCIFCLIFLKSTLASLGVSQSLQRYASPPPSSSKRLRTRNKTQIGKILNFLGLPKSNYSLTV